MKKTVLDTEQVERLAALAARPEHEIDTDDIPEAPAENWRYARRSSDIRPVKQSVTIRLDADVVTWFKQQAADAGYQTEINRVLRRYVDDAMKRSA